MLPAFQLVCTVGDVGSNIECPLVTLLFDNVLTYREQRRECTQLFEVCTLVFQSYSKGLVICGFNAQLRRIFFTGCDLIGIEDRRKHVAVVSCCLRISQTTPGISKVLSCYVFTVGPFDTVTKMEYVCYCTVFVLCLVVALSLSVSELSSTGFTVGTVDLFTGVCPFHQTLEQMMGHNATVNCRVQCRIHGLWLRRKVYTEIKTIAGNCAFYCGTCLRSGR